MTLHHNVHFSMFRFSTVSVMINKLNNKGKRKRLYFNRKSFQFPVMFFQTLLPGAQVLAENEKSADQKGAKGSVIL